MNNTDWQNLNALWRKKEEYLRKILKMTQERSFSAVEEDVERFYNFFQKREVVFSQIQEADFEIRSFNLNDDDKKSVFYKDVKEHIKNIDALAREIINLDKKNRAIMDKLMEHIKDNMKNIKMHKRVQHSYQDYFSTEYMQSSFDSKQ